MLPPPLPRPPNSDSLAAPPPPPEGEGSSWYEGIFNVGGPGWIRDIIDVKVEFDNKQSVRDRGAKFTVPFHSHKGCGQLCTPESVLTGSVTLLPPAGHVVFAGGVKVRVEEYTCLLDPFVTNDLAKVEMKPVVSSSLGIVVEGSKGYSFDFEIDLADAFPVDSNSSTKPDSCRLQEDYIGKNFSIKHALVVEVERPWWTFNVVHYEPICIYDRGNPAPHESRGRTGIDQQSIEDHIQDAVKVSHWHAQDCQSIESIRNELDSHYEREVNTPSHVLCLSNIPAEGKSCCAPPPCTSSLFSTRKIDSHGSCRSTFSLLNTLSSCAKINFLQFAFLIIHVTPGTSKKNFVGS